jgi:transcription-repair coupling factor (superfamily II helicase)
MMHLEGLTALLRDSRTYQDLLKQVRAGDLQFLNVIRAARPYFAAALASEWNAPVLYLTGRIKRAYNIAEQLPVWFGDSQPVLRFGEPAGQFYERTPWGEQATRTRLEALCALLPPDNEPPDHPLLVVSAARGLMQRTMPVNQFRKASLHLKVGQTIALDHLLQQLVGIGYEPTSVVIQPGTFSRRGGLVDIYPTASRTPVRVDFFGDEIDSLRPFDPATQRSEGKLNSVGITPAREALPSQMPEAAAQLKAWFATVPDDQDITRDFESLSNSTVFPVAEYYLPYLYSHASSLLDYAPDDALILIDDWEELRESVQEIELNAERSRQEQFDAGLLPNDAAVPYLSWEALEKTLSQHKTLIFNAASEAGANLFTPGSRFGGQLKTALTQTRNATRKGGRAVFVSEQTARLNELWGEQDAYGYVPILNALEEKPLAGTSQIVTGTLQEGWTLHLDNGETRLITDAELFGWERSEPRRRRSARPPKAPESNFSDWQEGDFVVHVDYGIGRFAGMRRRTIEGNERQYLVVEYGGNDTVFVPIHQADRVSRYVGVDDSPPTLSRLGQPEWSRARSRANKAVQEEAEELLKLYIEREKAQGHAFSPDNHWQRELEASFPYVETDDQLRAVREVKADMERVTPMDRLICGDVGYGKTEVALRAAFKAVNDGKQVAVLVPTTILAQQHFETFSNRLAPFPIVVEQLSRFRTKADQDAVLPRLASGEIDIIIGTHRILSEDVTLKDLGLVIIDEEQRFGVKQKEHFKQLRTQVDVLTLTATPIPRTLYMSLAGVRDISMIQTPPEERLPILTHVGAFDEHLVAQAINREIERGGQIFIVHNRVRSLEQLREQIEEIVPDVRIVTAHGQMNERHLEQVMAAFSRGEYDILLSTSIIENGIDIPNANTLIVDRADWFGLSQLYQLRGRVGRGAQQAYAYFFYHMRGLTEEARERLETLAEHTSLGAGYQIAMRDLEIRGAGDILSTRQTGHVAAVGLNLYTQMLNQAVQELKGTTEDSPVPVSATQSIILDLPLPAYLPEDWIPELSLRLQIYRRIANLTSQEDIDSMEEELRDRFGQLPKAVQGLLYQIRAKLLAQRVGATGIIVRERVVQVRLPYLAEINRAVLAHQLGDDVTVSRTAVEIPANDIWQMRLLTLLDHLRLLQDAVSSRGM